MKITKARLQARRAIARPVLKISPDLLRLAADCSEGNFKLTLDFSPFISGMKGVSTALENFSIGLARALGNPNAGKKYRPSIYNKRPVWGPQNAPNSYLAGLVFYLENGGFTYDWHRGYLAEYKRRAK